MYFVSTYILFFLLSGTAQPILYILHCILIQIKNLNSLQVHLCMHQGYAWHKEFILFQWISHDWFISDMIWNNGYDIGKYLKTLNHLFFPDLFLLSENHFFAIETWNISVLFKDPLSAVVSWKEKLVSYNGGKREKTK